MDYQNAVRELRKAYKQTQQQFANTLGISIRALAGYETGSKLGPTALFQLGNAARQKGLSELAELFLSGIEENDKPMVAVRDLREVLDLSIAMQKAVADLRERLDSLQSDQLNEEVSDELSTIDFEMGQLEKLAQRLSLALAEFDWATEPLK